jgi:hypothetical protein
LFPYFRERGRTGPTCEAAAKAVSRRCSPRPALEALGNAEGKLGMPLSELREAGLVEDYPPAPRLTSCTSQTVPSGSLKVTNEL